MTGKKELEERERKERTAAEMATVVISAAIVLFLLGYSLYHAAFISGDIPRLSAAVLVDESVRVDGDYSVPVEIRSESGPTAQDVRVLIRVIGPDGEERERLLLINYLPERSMQREHILLDMDPSDAEIEAEIHSYRLP